MDLKNCKELINRMECNVYDLQRMSFVSVNMYEKMFYWRLSQQEIYKINVLKEFLRNIEESEKIYIGDENMRQQDFTLEELIKYDGKKGNNAYIAIDGIVYDVTYNAAWGAGTHFGMEAGRDLTGQISACHNKEEILKGLTQVGVISNGR